MGSTPCSAPRSIAFVGTSGDPTRIGGRPLSYCLREGFAGPLYPINAGRAEVQGLTAYPSLADVPEDEIDLAVIAIAPALVADAIRDAGTKRVKAAVILSSGFAEVGEGGAALQAAMLDAARAAGIRLLGPTASARSATGAACARPSPACWRTAACRWDRWGSCRNRAAQRAPRHADAPAPRGLSRFVTTGNEADITVADCVCPHGARPRCRRDRLFRRHRRRSSLPRRGGGRAAAHPIVMLKVGRSEDGRKAAQSHTASLAGDDAVFDAAARARRASDGWRRRRRSSTCLHPVPAAPGRGGIGWACSPVSGGAGVLMADAAAGAGFALPPVRKARRPRSAYGCRSVPRSIRSTPRRRRSTIRRWSATRRAQCSRRADTTRSSPSS
ncbi:CoA-binding protein [Sphingomonas sp. MMS24-JH45]